ncbi:glycosyltransferase family 4 protein [Photobacterium arenosum]|uniref:glycosyltransferase family 4 protein n=1 Tax=Photobacterium arenosum TaxID=2774143 RepID=UPI00288AA9BB|nr:glycosyltransferase family 4 protein [Photobacterium arenosum]
MNNIYIFTHSVSRKNGGSSSILDLANCMSDMDLDVEVRTVLGKLDKFIYKTSNVNKKLNIKCISNTLMLERKIGRSKKTLNKFFSAFNRPLIPKDSVIIDSFGIPFDYKRKLQKNGCKIVLNHAGSVKAYANYFMSNGYDGGNNIEKYIEHIKTYDRVLFQSESQANELDSLLGTGEKRSILIRPSVSKNDVADCINNAKNIFKNNKINITVVGSVQKRKGQDFLIDIVKNLDSKANDYVINVVGNVLEKEFYQGLLEEISNNSICEKIIFHGFQKDYLSYMNDSDIILQVSKEEGVSRILREAMALGKPIASFRLDGTSDLLEDGYDCLLAVPESVADITSKLQQLIDSEELRLSLGQRARLNFDRKYSYKSYSEQVKEFLNVMLGKNNI